MKHFNVCNVLSAITYLMNFLAKTERNKVHKLCWGHSLFLWKIPTRLIYFNRRRRHTWMMMVLHLIPYIEVFWLGRCCCYYSKDNNELHDVQIFLLQMYLKYNKYKNGHHLLPSLFFFFQKLLIRPQTHFVWTELVIF